MLEKILSFIYPKYLTCCLCGQSLDLDYKEPLCKVCQSSLQYTSDPCCQICGKIFAPSEAYGVCGSCKLLSLNFEQGTSLWLYDEVIKPLIFKFKYKEATHLYEWLSEQMIEKISEIDLPFEFDYIISVPMHRNRYKQRAYDPVKGLCQSFSKKTGIPLFEGLERTVDTPALYKLDAHTRKDILKDVFSITKNDDYIKNKTILLIDDIYTTGNTVNACAKALKSHGAAYIYVLTLCVGEI